MHAATKESRLAELLAPVILETGLVLDEVTIMPAGARSVVRVTVDLPEDEVGAADLDLVSDATHAASAALDSSDIFDDVEEYVLEVSTPGVDRKLVTPAHFKRARTRLVIFTLQDGSEIKGRLHEVDEAGCTTSKITGGVKGRPSKEHPPALVTWAEIVSGQVQVEFTRIDEVELGPEVDDTENDAIDDDSENETDFAADFQGDDTPNEEK